MASPTSSCSSGTAARRTRARSPTCAPRWPSSGSTRTRRACARSATTRTPTRERFTGSPTIRIDGADVAAADDEPVAADLPRLPPPRRARLPRPRPRRPARRAARRACPPKEPPDEPAHRRPRADVRPARHRRRASRSPRRQRAGDRRRLHLQPLPVRARLARADRRRRARLRRARRRASWPSTPTTPSATRATRSTRWRERVGPSDGWPMPYLHDETQEVARAYGARRRPTCSSSTPTGRLAYRGAPDADYEDERQHAAWLREALDDVLAGAARAACRRPSRSAARSSGGRSAQSRSSSRLSTLPVALRGSSSRNTTSRGTL